MDFNLQVARVTSQVNASVGDRVRRQTGVCVTIEKIVLKLVDTWIARSPGQNEPWETALDALRVGPK